MFAFISFICERASMDSVFSDRSSLSSIGLTDKLVPAAQSKKENNTENEVEGKEKELLVSNIFLRKTITSSSAVNIKGIVHFSNLRYKVLNV
jgi:hypothetical protein